MKHKRSLIEVIVAERSQIKYAKLMCVTPQIFTRACILRLLPQFLSNPHLHCMVNPEIILYYVHKINVYNMCKLP
ncbi:MAG: hypothetical protein MJE68_19310, partial [Proteobacteria bacterium]|nr:hypothetical protein [Pseudomonadota bacterium]